MPHSYYPSNQYYMQDLQNMRERIDSQIRQIQQQQQNQIQQPVQQPITQNFQLAPNPINNELECKYANNIDEVTNTFVSKTGIFINKDFSNFWVKDTAGNIRTFQVEEIIEMDEKDKEILNLKKQIEEMKGEIANAKQSDISDITEPTTSKKSTRVSSNKSSTTK